MVEGKDFLVTYQIVNSGNAAASKIEVSDRYDPTRLVMCAMSILLYTAFHTNGGFLISFESKNNVNSEGNVEFELEELAPGTIPGILPVF